MYKYSMNIVYEEKQEFEKGKLTESLGRGLAPCFSSNFTMASLLFSAAHLIAVFPNYNNQHHYIPSLVLS